METQEENVELILSFDFIYDEILISGWQQKMTDPLIVVYCLKRFQLRLLKVLMDQITF